MLVLSTPGITSAYGDMEPIIPLVRMFGRPLREELENEQPYEPSRYTRIKQTASAINYAAAGGCQGSLLVDVTLGSPKGNGISYTETNEEKCRKIHVSCSAWKLRILHMA